MGIEDRIEKLEHLIVPREEVREPFDTEAFFAKLGMDYAQVLEIKKATGCSFAEIAARRLGLTPREYLALLKTRAEQL